MHGRRLGLRVGAEQHRDVGRVERAARQHGGQRRARAAPRLARRQRQRDRGHVVPAINVQPLSTHIAK